MPLRQPTSRYHVDAFRRQRDDAPIVKQDLTNRAFGNRVCPDRRIPLQLRSIEGSNPALLEKHRRQHKSRHYSDRVPFNRHAHIHSLPTATPSHHQMLPSSRQSATHANLEAAPECATIHPNRLPLCWYYIWASAQRGVKLRSRTGIAVVSTFFFFFFLDGRSAQRIRNQGEIGHRSAEDATAGVS